MAGLFALLALLLAMGTAYAVDTPSTLLHVVDYIAADYSGAVDQGRVKNADEYKEMREFAEQALALGQSLPEHARKPELLQQAQELKALVMRGAPAPAVSAAAGHLHQTLIEAFQIQSVPRAVPALASAPALYERECSGCHGVNGLGDGPASRAMDPPPANFQDATRMSRRSVFSLYNTITQGVSGTAMPSFATLSEADRWTLALYVSNLAPTSAERQQGEAAWRREGRWNQVFARAQTVYASSPDELRAQLGSEAVSVQAFLRAHPETLASLASRDPVVFAQATVESARQAYNSGDRARARQLAIQAYLEGFELVESRLSTLDSALVHETERAMMSLRQQIDAGTAVNIDAPAAAVRLLLDRGRAALERGPLSAGTSFFSALLIFVREGLEALLVVAGIISILIRANRRDALPYVHVGWIGACALGLLTWMVATYLVSVSGASRELTEGVSALLAALMLVYVGYWLHTRSAAGAWQHFIRDHVGSALAKRSLWTMAALAFISVYREMFETVLFYQALWIEAGAGARGAVLAGVGVGALTLALIGYALLKYGIKLPLGAFFATSAALLCVLAVVMAGEGIHSLQEAGTLASTPVDGPTVSWLGIFPTLQTLVGQLTLAIAIAAVLWLARRRAAVRI
ncbi:MAG: FTR1 family protein [Proteobacteria bacterium]|nr:FTR1 family protein [Pseudomonadota bacterium]